MLASLLKLTKSGPDSLGISCISKKKTVLFSNYYLRIEHIHDAKTLKIRPLWHVLLHYLITRPSIKNLYEAFLAKWPTMQKVCLHLKTDFSHPWPLGQKSVIQIFDRWSGYENNEAERARGV